MEESMIIRVEVLFKSSPDQVWDLLTNPAKTKLYMFGCELVSDWKVGSPVHWKGRTENGQEAIYVTGKVLQYEHGKRVITTTFDPNAEMADIPINHVELSYEIDEVSEGTLLTIVQGDFAGAKDGAKRYEESKGGWESVVVPAMKKILD